MKVTEPWRYSISTMALAYFFFCVLRRLFISCVSVDRYSLLPTPFSAYETCFRFPVSVAVLFFFAPIYSRVCFGRD